MADQQIISETVVISSLFILVCESNTYNLLVQRNYFQKQSPIASLQKCVLQVCSKLTGGGPNRNLISKKNYVAFLHGCSTLKLLENCRTPFLEEHLWTGSVFYIICFGASNK